MQVIGLQGCSVLVHPCCLEKSCLESSHILKSTSWCFLYLLLLCLPPWLFCSELLFFLSFWFLLVPDLVLFSCCAVGGGGAVLCYFFGDFSLQNIIFSLGCENGHPLLHKKIFKPNQKKKKKSIHFSPNILA